MQGRPPVITPASVPLPAPEPADRSRISVALDLDSGSPRSRERMLGALAIATRNIELVDLYVLGTNLEPNSVARLAQLSTQLYVSEQPASQMFRLLALNVQLKTEWLVWISETTFMKRDDWLLELKTAIAETDDSVGVLGTKLLHRLEGRRQKEWFSETSWWQNQQLRLLDGTEAPNGSCILYPSKGFFAIKRQAIIECQIPDSRITDSGYEIVIGEQLHQNGYKLKAFDPQGRYVKLQIGKLKKDRYPWQGSG
jgi:hypothetical protein